VSNDQALELFARVLQVAMFVAGPVLLASLVAGLFVGILQAATQINEASVSFIVKVTSVLAVLITLGPLLVTHTVDYARSSFAAIEHVVR
jgi:flagellar biosynthetic protein FliQ